jgi:hypothetical protein
LGSLAFLVRAYGINATPPGQHGYESVVSQVVAAVAGRGAFYYTTMAAVLAVLALSANTSFADFPRVCRVLATERYLPAEFARRGSRLVFTNGILVLSTLAAILLIVFGGVTDHLIPLFAIGALLAFTMSQLGMVMHWWRRPRDPHRTLKLAVNGVGAVATTVALSIVLVSKFSHGAWITALVIPAFVLLFQRMKKYNNALMAVTHAEGPLDTQQLTPPIVVIPLRRLDQVGRKALRFAMTISPDVYVVQVLAEELDTEDLRKRWRETVEEPVRRVRRQPPVLVLVRSPYRQFFAKLLEWLLELVASEPERHIIVLLPELVHRRWYQFIVNHRAVRLKAQLLLKGGPQVSVMSTPWYPDLPPADARARWPNARFRRPNSSVVR